MKQVGRVIDPQSGNPGIGAAAARGTRLTTA